VPEAFDPTRPEHRRMLRDFLDEELNGKVRKDRAWGFALFLVPQEGGELQSIANVDVDEVLSHFIIEE
jgi:hypothetical protein